VVEAAYCTSAFNYVSDSGLVPVEVTVRNARVDTPGPFDVVGFARTDAPSGVTDWGDPRHLDDVHRPEIEAAALDFTGCRHAVVYTPIVRSPEVASTIPDHAPIETVHSDFTDDYRRMIHEPDRAYRGFLDPLLARDGLTTDDLRDASRIMMLQFWRNTGPVDADRPLALCDPRSVGEDRLVRMVVPDYGGVSLDFETFLVTAPDDAGDDAWYTFPQLTANEVVLIRTYDSECEAAGAAYWTPHSAFTDPHVAPGGPHARKSVEMRALCVWN